MQLLTYTRRTPTTLAFLALIVTNVMTLTHTAFNAAISGLLSTAFGISTVTEVMNDRLAKRNAKIASQNAALMAQRKAALRFGSRLAARAGKLVTFSPPG